MLVGGWASSVDEGGERGSKRGDESVCASEDGILPVLRMQNKSDFKIRELGMEMKSAPGASRASSPV